MLNVLRFYVPNSADNYNYILYCPKSSEAFVIDPFNAELIDEKLRSNGLKMTGILLTHEHTDHTSGVSRLIKKQTLPVYGHPEIEGVNMPLSHNQTIHLGEGELTALFTPGHTFKHFCFTSEDQSSPYLICADTLFNAGVGNTYSGDTDLLFNTIKTLSIMKGETRIYPAHDYMLNNLEFLLSLEPNNQDAKYLRDRNRDLAPDDRQVTNWEMEQKVNPFLRLDNDEIIKSINAKDRSELSVFRALRQRRNLW